MATKHRFYISIAEEDEFRREFDTLVNLGQTKAETFHSWMRYARHANFDVNRGLWYTMR